MRGSKRKKRKQSRIRQGQVKDCRVEVGGEGESSVDPWWFKKRKQQS